MRPQFSDRHLLGREARLIADVNAQNIPPAPETPEQQSTLQRGLNILRMAADPRQVLDAATDYAGKAITSLGEGIHFYAKGVKGIGDALQGKGEQKSREATARSVGGNIEVGGGLTQKILSKISLEGRIAIRDSELQIQNINVDVSGNLEVTYVKGNKKEVGVGHVSELTIPDGSTDIIDVAGPDPNNNNWKYAYFKASAVEAALLKGLDLANASAANDTTKSPSNGKPSEAKQDVKPEAKPEGKNETTKEQITRELEGLRKKYDEIFAQNAVTEAQKAEKQGKLNAISMEIFFKTLELFISSIPKLHEKIYGKRENTADDNKVKGPGAKPGEIGKHSAEKTPDAKVDDLQRKLNAQNEDLNTLNTAITAKEKESGEMQKNIDTMKQEFNKMEDQTSAKALILRGKIEDQTKYKAIADERVATLKSQKTKLEASIVETKKELDAAKKAAAEKTADKSPDGAKTENVDALKLLQEALKALPASIRKIMGIVDITADGIKFEGGVLAEIFMNAKGNIVSITDFAAKRAEIMQEVLNKLTPAEAAALRQGLEAAGLLAGVSVPEEQKKNEVAKESADVTQKKQQALADTKANIRTIYDGAKERLETSYKRLMQNIVNSKISLGWERRDLSDEEKPFYRESTRENRPDYVMRRLLDLSGANAAVRTSIRNEEASRDQVVNDLNDLQARYGRLDQGGPSPTLATEKYTEQLKQWVTKETNDTKEMRQRAGNTDYSEVDRQLDAALKNIENAEKAIRAVEEVGIEAAKITGKVMFGTLGEILSGLVARLGLATGHTLGGMDAEKEYTNAIKEAALDILSSLIGKRTPIKKEQIKGALKAVPPPVKTKLREFLGEAVKTAATNVAEGGMEEVFKTIMEELKDPNDPKKIA